jgi:hypothetical protein
VLNSDLCETNINFYLQSFQILFIQVNNALLDLMAMKTVMLEHTVFDLLCGCKEARISSNNILFSRN